MKNIKLLSLLIAASLFLASCSDDDEETNDNMPSTTSELNVDITGLEELGADFDYEGWVIVDGSPVSTGTFDVNTDGSLTQSSFDVDASTLSNATMFVLSIEPVPDSDPAPADTKILSGEISNNSANLTANGLIGDFAGTSGTFFMRTPTDETGTNNNNDQYGVWFGSPGMPPTANNDFPALPAGWAYEGWVVGEQGPITTGVITSFDAADAFSDFSGTSQSGPPVPGEDFFNNAPSGETFPLDIRGRTIVISIEPVPDNSSAPFLLKPIIGTAGQDLAPATHDLSGDESTFPTGTVSF